MPARKRLWKQGREVKLLICRLQRHAEIWVRMAREEMLRKSRHIRRGAVGIQRMSQNLISREIFEARDKVHLPGTFFLRFLANEGLQQMEVVGARVGSMYRASLRKTR